MYIRTQIGYSNIMNKNDNPYQSDINRVWCNKLLISHDQISKRIFMNTGKNLLRPNFEINSTNNQYWGLWNPNTRTISISLRLLENFEWGAVEYVLKHEMAHQMVDEVFNVPTARAHGEWFKKACEILGIEAHTCDSPDFLSKFGGNIEDPIVDKVRKLFSKGNNEAATEAETQAFISKAHELMVKHNLDLSKIIGTEQNKAIFIKSPVGANYKTYPSYLGFLSQIIRDYYNVQTIVAYCGSYRYVEFFGEPTNVQIATYVYHCVLNNAENLFNEFQKAEQEKYRQEYYKAYKLHKERNGGSIEGFSFRKGIRTSRGSYMTGLFHGFRNKLEQTHKILKDTIKPEDGELIPTSNKKLLEEMYHEAYPKMRILKSQSFRGNGYHQGLKDSVHLRVRDGVANNGNQAKQLVG